MEIVNRSTVYNGHYKLRKLTLRNGEKEFSRELFDTPDSVCAIIYDTTKDKYIFVRQFRVSAEKKLTEIVAGRLDEKDEDRETALKREIGEETGYETDSLEFISEFYLSPGACSEKTSLYYAEVSRKSSAGGGLSSENEQIELIELDLEEVQDKVFEDAKSVVARYYLMQKQLNNKK